ncbi:uncharacterized protein B0I36DRAFT_367066 [Microdochium trichocladiopsis]|uniref:Uncharacterized protein n=1 Tax=Microdochium trichocladiopsis TaxID=1682393 RepID=A0A9P8XYK1_9PEZI|nr:uncharacterized protein B0I36DRAFT_367066 [Microdochium trichocladiopsis]KAH7025188.1 hypothetical protein B0I36DRAFT_367066 [Microdochium trichocladiopsis]
MAVCCQNWGIYDAEKCAAAQTKYTDAYFHENDPTSIFWPLYQGRTRWAVKSKRWSLYTFVNRFLSFNASDPRDKVHTLIGLADSVEHVSRLPPISYQGDTFGAFWSVIVAELEASLKLDFLADGCGIQRPEGFPSWMPLWYETVDRFTTTSLARLERGPGVKYRASGRSICRAQLRSQQRLLALAGVFVGRVVGVGKAMDRDAAHNDQLALRTQWAGMLGLQNVKAEFQRLFARLERREVSRGDVQTLFAGYLREQPIEKKNLYELLDRTMLGAVMRVSQRNGV